MSSHALWDARYVVVDVETSGHDPAQHRIIEIACLVVEDGQVVERFVSLVNARQPVPPSITALTGITNGMLAQAPCEEEVFARVVPLLAHPGSIFVAHNAAFDWKFLTATLERLGYGELSALPRLCTYRLARRLLPPTLRRKGLDGLIAYFGIRIRERHRAEPDAEATVDVLRHLIELAAQREILDVADLLRLQYAPLRYPSRALPRRIAHRLQQLPETPGVYSFIDRHGRILYIGKARNLQQRVRAHFTGDAALRYALNGYRIWDIRWEETPTELSALLRETVQIWHAQPPANVVGKEIDTYAFIRVTLSEPLPRLEVVRQLPTGEDAWLGPFPSMVLALRMSELLRAWYGVRTCGSALSHAPHESLLSPMQWYDSRPCIPAAG